MPLNHLPQADPLVADALRQELARERDRIELIASENFTSPAVMEAVGSVLTNKYAEGYPRKRYYGGCEDEYKRQVYGLGVAVEAARSPQVLFDIKRRDRGKPVAWLVGDASDLERYGREVPDVACALARAHWPGPLTLVVKASQAVPPAFRSAEGTIGLRMPDSETALALVRAAGGPVATTSANLSGGPAPRTFEELDPALVAAAAAAVRDDARKSGVASTVVDLSLIHIFRALRCPRATSRSIPTSRFPIGMRTGPATGMAAAAAPSPRRLRPPTTGPNSRGRSTIRRMASTAWHRQASRSSLTDSCTWPSTAPCSRSTRRPARCSKKHLSPPPLAIRAGRCTRKG